jgi:hypothetical protein
MKRSVVLDTNVLLVASNRSPQASPKCVLVCVEALVRIQSSERVVFDQGYLIIVEYRNNLSPSGQPGLGDAFLKWLWQNQANPECCEVVEIHARPGPVEDYEEFPNDPALTDFDPRDRKFVAVALASPSRPPVLNATDSDWWNYRGTLEDHGVRVEFLCPKQFTTQRVRPLNPRASRKPRP